MRSFVAFIIFYVFQQDVECYLFNDTVETEILNVDCDKANRLMPEGNIGQTKMFPWLGILRVHIHEPGSLKIAVTGVVLVKDKFAIGNAYDISKIPQSKLRSDSQVMFITENNEPWFCKVVDYMAHPEYDITTVNTIAVLELYKENTRIKSTPICWPHSNFNTSNLLFAIGYTDENQLLEKTIDKLEFVDKILCNEFYKRSKLVAVDLTGPANYRCAYGIHSKKECVWENGMVVASNASGQWTIIGLVVRGPGCSAPSRFLDTTAYMPWLITIMDLDANNGGPSEDIVMRRSAFGVGFKRKNMSESS